MGQTPQELANSLAFTEELAREVAKNDFFILQLVKALSDKEIVAKILREYASYGLYSLIVDVTKQVVAPELMQYINSLPEDKKMLLIAEALEYHLPAMLAPELKNHIKPLTLELVKHEVFIKTFAEKIGNYAIQSRLFRDRLLSTISDITIKEFKDAVVDTVKEKWSDMEKVIIDVVKKSIKELAEKASSEVGERIVKKVKNDEMLQNELAAKVSELVLSSKEFVEHLVERVESELIDRIVKNTVPKLTEELVPKIAERILQDHEFLQLASERVKEELIKKAGRRIL